MGASKGSVLVAMSGGVDSSVAAALLCEQGYEVVGAHMKLVHLSSGGVDHGCCGPRAREDAEEVARILGISFDVVDVSVEFEETVIDDFFSEHRAGRTPNPCVRCNEHIKFGTFLRLARERDLDFVATGHYVRTERDPAGRIRLLRGLDPAKDQSYVLHVLGQEQLERSLFPIGELSKPQTRAHAERLGLPVAGKPDSQEVCFVPGRDHAAFVEEFLPTLVREGEVVDTSGTVVARHRGLFRYTVGQRRGLGVSRPEPTYVVDIDPAENRVVVGSGELLARSGLVADRVRWVAGEPPCDDPFEAEARIRYRGECVPAVARPAGERLEVSLRTPQRGVAPGQSVVLYRGEEVLGGGRIVASVR